MDSDNDIAPFDLALQTEKIGFAPSDLLDCPRCNRMNAPDRETCIYCGSVLPARAYAPIRLSTRTLEPWEKGWNLIMISSGPQVNVAEASKFLSLDPEWLNDAVDHGGGLPLRRLESEGEAAASSLRLTELGFQTCVVADEALNADRLPRRLAAIEFGEEQIRLVDFNTRERIEFTAAQLKLIVLGTIATSRVDSIEKRRRGKETKVLDETATTTDGRVIDLYLDDDVTGWRVNTSGFDFSSLGPDKSLLTAENLDKLVGLLTRSAPEARITESYDRVRHLLEEVWESDHRRDSLGLKRSGFAKKEFAASMSSNNLVQFTKYSRLQRALI